MTDQDTYKFSLRMNIAIIPRRKEVYDALSPSNNSYDGKIIFFNAPEDTIKTCVLHLVLAEVRSTDTFALAIAVSCIGSTLLRRSRTTNKTLKRPLKTVNDGNTNVCKVP